jgi:hypothetical protein
MEHPLDTYHIVKYAEKDHISSKRSHSQAGRQVFPADISVRGSSDSFALIHQLANKMPGIGPTVLGGMVANIDQILSRLRRKGYSSHQAAS